MSTQKYTFPAVSVIIPLYNVEKYIAECLDSLLLQTFTDFEVIVVDDCSTDSSPAVVESYAEKFGGRLRFFKTKKNTGSGTEPRNLGIIYSRGEYLYFMDNDDTVTPTALEELYTLAKDYDADVVHCEKNFEIPDKFYHDAEYRKNLKASCHPSYEKIFITKPTLLAEDFAQRAVDFTKGWLTWSIWVQLIRRSFILENKLRFVGIALDDKLFTICEICSAKRYLVVPNVIYMHRVHSGSLLWQDSDNAEKFLHSRLTMLKDGFRYFEKFLDEQRAFSSRLDLKYLLFDMFSKEIVGNVEHIYRQLPAYALDKILRKEFGEDVTPALKAFIFSAMNINRLLLKRTLQKAAVMENELKSDRRQLTLAQERIAALEAELRRAD